MPAAFTPGDRVRPRRRAGAANKGTVRPGSSSRRVIVRLDSTGTSRAFQPGELELDLPPAPPEPAPALMLPMMLTLGSGPGMYAVPGAMWPGAIWPATPLTPGGSSGGTAVFTGTQVYIYPQYCDLSVLETLVAVPGSTYDIRVVGGDPGLPALPGDGRWYVS
jgi:hypothetical protein